LRTETGLGLKEAKDAIERSPHDLRAIASLPSPGEVPRAPGVVRWLLVIVVVAAEGTPHASGSQRTASTPSIAAMSFSTASATGLSTSTSV
jgi:hypothetical protein